MAPYRVVLRADKGKYPILLSNGNLVDEGDLGNGRHYAVWDDPFAKPSYLFALVAGRFEVLEDRIVRASGREALLQIYVEPGNLDKTAHAMASLKRAIAWDERRFGLELDLDRFMIVASNDFNMGAMENKGLNIFNAKYVLAHPYVATDTDYAAHRSDRRPRVLPQLDRQPRDVPRLVPAEPEGRADGLPRPGVLGRHAGRRGAAAA